VRLSAAAVLTIDGDFTIVRAAELREALLARLATAPSELALDLGAVSDFDSAGVQLLLATRRSLAEAGAQLHIVATSSAVRQALALFGLAALAVEPADAVTPEELK